MTQAQRSVKLSTTIFCVLCAAAFFSGVLNTPAIFYGGIIASVSAALGFWFAVTDL